MMKINDTSICCSIGAIKVKKVKGDRLLYFALAWSASGTKGGLQAQLFGCFRLPRL